MKLHKTAALGLLLVIPTTAGALANVPDGPGTASGASVPHSKNVEDSDNVPVLLQIKGVATTEQAGDSQSSKASSVSRPANQVSPEGLRAIAQRIPAVPNEQSLSAVTAELMKQWNLEVPLTTLETAFKKWKASKDAQDAIAYLMAKQEYNETLIGLLFDVRRCTNAIDREIARNATRAASLAELRDKAIRYNTYADFVAGGLTGILAGALELGDLSRFAYNSVDVAEGVGQSVLSSWAFRAEHRGDRRQGAIPNVLNAIIDPSAVHNAYPPSVRSFLNTAPAGETQTRADILVHRWKKLNFCLIHSGHRMNKQQRVKHITGTHTEAATLTIDLLEDRTAMLQDLRAEVTIMDEHLAELLALLRKY